MIDVFVRVCCDSALRLHMAETVLARLYMQADARVCAVIAEDSLMPSNMALYQFTPRENAWKTMREIADSQARSNVYVVIDDDHLPIGRDWLFRGVVALLARPEYAMLSAWSINGEVRDPGGDDDVFDAQSCGTPCFVRKGTFAQLPDGPADSYDLVLSEFLKQSGQIGFLRHVRFNHIGCEYSQVVPGHWGA